MGMAIFRGYIAASGSWVFWASSEARPDGVTFISQVESRGPAGWVTLYEVDFRTFPNEDIGVDGTINITGSVGSFNWQRNNNVNATYMSYSNGEGLAIALNANNSDYFNNVRTSPMLVLPLSGVIPDNFNYEEIDLKIETTFSTSNQGTNFEMMKNILEVSSTIGSVTNVGAGLVYNAGLEFQIQATEGGTSANVPVSADSPVEDAIQFIITGPEGARIFSAQNASGEFVAPDQYRTRAWAQWGAGSSNRLLTNVPTSMRDLNYIFLAASAATSQDAIIYMKRFRIQYRLKN